MTPSSAINRWGKDYLPNSVLLDQDRREVRFYDDLIKGKIVVFSFVFTSCKNICPLTIARLAEVQELLASAMGREIFFVSVSIDPIPDTPEKLKDYARAFKAGPGWSFITGKPEDIDLVRWKLGERSGEAIAQHKNEVIMYNDATGEWSRNSVFADLGVLTASIRSMHPSWRSEKAEHGKHFERRADALDTADKTGQALFIKACASCHTIGHGDKVGPDLSGVTERRSADWVKNYMMAPDKIRAKKDPTARVLEDRFPLVRMPNLGLSATDAEDLIAYIELRQRSANAGGTATK